MANLQVRRVGERRISQLKSLRFARRMGAQQPLQQNLVDAPAEADFAIEEDYRHAVGVLGLQLGIRVDVPFFRC